MSKETTSAAAVTDGLLSSCITGTEKKKKVVKASSKPADTVETVKPEKSLIPPKKGEWHVTHGSALIVNIKTFSDSMYQSRRGSDKDMKRLATLLRSLGFTVQCVNNQTRDNVIKELETFAAARDSARDDCVLVAVMTHGEAGGTLLARDGRTFTVKDVWRPFVDNPLIADTPKIFIFQACRGNYKDLGKTVKHYSTSKGAQRDAGPSESDAALAKVASTAEVEVHLPNVPNVLLAYSTIEDYVSWRSETHGAHYVSALCEALRSEAKSSCPRGLVATLTKAHRALSTQEPCMSTRGLGSPLATYKQGATFTSYLRYKLFFHLAPPSRINSEKY